MQAGQVTPPPDKSTLGRVGGGHAVCFLRFHQRGGAKGGHTFHWETLTEDTVILELIQSWKQRPPEGDHVWGELAAALLRVC